MTIKRILVTGSSGTIGTRLCERLLGLGYKVTGLDIKPNKWSKAVNSITMIGDLRDGKAFDRLPKDVDMVIHLAANARVYDLVLRPDLARDNLDMLFNTLEFCRKRNVRKFMFASSREVYGNTREPVHAEDDVHVSMCESPYTASKLGGEAMVHAYRQCYGIDFIIMRFSNVYGMYDDSDRVIPLFIRSTKAGRDLVIYGKDKMLDFTYIDDAVDGVMKCICKFDAAKNQVYNIAFGEGATIIKVAELIRSRMGSRNKITLKGNRTGEVVRFVADITKARKKLGYGPVTGLEEGIGKSVDWYTRNRD